MDDKELKNAFIWDEVGQFDHSLLQALENSKPRFDEQQLRVNPGNFAGGTTSDNTGDWNLVGNKNHLGGVGLWDQMQKSNQNVYNQEDLLKQMEKLFNAGNLEDIFKDAAIPPKSVKRIPLKFRRSEK